MFGKSLSDSTVHVACLLMGCRLETVTVSWQFEVSETPTSTVWVNLMTQDGVAACGYPGYTQALVQGSGAILQVEVSHTNPVGSFNWTIPNHVYEADKS